MKNKELYDKVLVLYDAAQVQYDDNTKKEKEAMEALKEHPDDFKLKTKKVLSSSLRSNYLGQMVAYVAILDILTKED